MEKTNNIHVGIILDGNGRWAKKRGMPRNLGHLEGVRNIKRIALKASELGIKCLSLFCFSTENWKRPKEEVDYLMNLPKMLKEDVKDSFEKENIKVVFSYVNNGKLSQENMELMNKVSEDSKDRTGLILNFCFNYGSLDDLVNGIKEIVDEKIKKDNITKETIFNHLSTRNLPPLDLLIRTSGEMRLSNFMLLEASYAELYFPKKYWPAFKEKDLIKALKVYHKRNRRFGGL